MGDWSQLLHSGRAVYLQWYNSFSNINVSSAFFLKRISVQKFVLAGIGLAQVLPPAMPVLGVDKTPEDPNPLTVDLFLYMEQQKCI